MSTARQSTIRRFHVVRDEDVSGTSGTGVVAEGVQFSNGSVVVHWLSQLESTEQCPSIYVFEQIHGHGGRTHIVWLDGMAYAEVKS